MEYPEWSRAWKDAREVSTGIDRVLDPRIWSHEPLDHTHLEDAIQIQDNRPQVEQAPPPVPFVPQAQYPWDALHAHYDRYRPYPGYYMRQQSNAALWYAAEQEKKAAA